MRVQKCGLIDYPEGQIFSLDFHPSGKFLATCGNDGKGKGLVTIWDTAFLKYDPEASEEEDIAQENVNDPALPAPSHPLPQDDAIDTISISSDASLCSLPEGLPNDYKKFKMGEKEMFSNNQNCVRWSRIKKGRWLAACGDSSVVHLYEPIFDAEKNKVSLENSISLTGHTMEVLQVEFSTNGRYLASCSLDNSIIIWSMEEQPRKLHILNSECGGHNNFVTGLAWDPTEKFLASQSMDKTLKLWRCDNWECERTIKGHFTTPSRTSLFFRLDWSTDGTFLIATCAENSGFQTAKLIVRKDFQQDRDFVGFNAPVSCVRSNQRCILHEDPVRGEVAVNLVAIGSLDQSVSVWLLPYVRRPLCVIENLFPEGILDMSWNKETLSVVGINGSVRCLVFDQSEIGRFLSGREMFDHFDRLYGKIPQEFREFQRRLNEDGGSEWIKQILKGVYEPSEELTVQATDCHEFMPCHTTLTPSCAKCRNFYSKMSEHPK